MALEYLILSIIFIIVAIIIILALSIKTVRPTERAVVERFGKFNRVLPPGLNFIIPFIEGLIYVNTTERMVDAEPQEIITKDSLNAQVDAQIYFQVMQDPESVKKSLYNVNDYEYQIVSLARTTLRNIIGGMIFTEVNSKRNILNDKLAKELDEQTNGWGIKIVRAELMEIKPPTDVQETMNEVLKAANTKSAAVDYATATETEADGKKRAAIREAEGQSQAIVLVANADRDATVAKANGDAQAIKLVNESAQKYFKGAAIDLKKLETAQASLESNTKIIVPTGSNLVNLIGDIAGLNTKK